MLFADLLFLHLITFLMFILVVEGSGTPFFGRNWLGDSQPAISCQDPWNYPKVNQLKLTKGSAESSGKVPRLKG